MKRNVFLINLFFLLAILASLLVIRHLTVTGNWKPKKDDPNSPDAYMINASFIRTNEQGEPEITLASPYVTHYQAEDRSYLKMPVIYLYKNNEEWQVTAHHARGSHGTTQFDLYENVKIKQKPSLKNPGSELLTSFLTVFPKQDLVTTSSPITITQPGVKINAVGLRGDLKTGNITLLSKTRGEYDPSSSH